MINRAEYVERRNKLAKKLSKNSVSVVLSGEQKIRSNDTEYPYRQNSDFYYLTGFKEDKAALVFVKKKKKVRVLLFVQKKDKKLELWNGKRLGEIKAKKRILVDEVFSSDLFEEKLKEFLKDKKKVYFDLDSEDARAKSLKKLSKGFRTHESISAIVQRMRLIKSNSEIKLIQKAIDITQEAHHKAMSFKKTGKKEYELQAKIEYIFKSSGAYSDAYTSIVACGNSANTLHYVQNNKPLVENALILIDAGCEYEYYASDITRTIPVTGRFSEAQKELYNMVLDVQYEILRMIKPHAKRSQLQKRSEELLCEGMIRLGILKGKLKKLIKKQEHKKYYPHGIGHWMGIDVHDQAPYKDKIGKEIALKKGMVLTIEPGIYIDKNDKTVPKKYRGIGIRIEDDILVTKNGCKNLSAKIAKTVREIEALGSR
ncbi:aminopeptidase P N-terminal domain-containing protein [bacterium]|nr:aminopeptidase P N-terminal domain-containing protein [bacterium]MBU1990766.1 aminopeptidase P N-terminal domain-containing protein [bacterium]